jgi:hypothetical protein
MYVEKVFLFVDVIAEKLNDSLAAISESIDSLCCDIVG